jgi:hypothetical protein
MTKYHRKVRHWSKILTENQILKQNIIVMSDQLLLRTYNSAAYIESLFLWSNATTSQLFFASLLLLYLRFDPITLSKGNMINSKTRQNNATQVDSRPGDACGLRGKRGKERGGGGGRQLSWALTLFRTLKQTKLVTQMHKEEPNRV